MLHTETLSPFYQPAGISECVLRSRHHTQGCGGTFSFKCIYLHNNLTREVSYCPDLSKMQLIQKDKEACPESHSEEVTELALHPALLTASARSSPSQPTSKPDTEIQRCPLGQPCISTQHSYTRRLVWLLVPWCAGLFPGNAKPASILFPFVFSMDQHVHS